MEKKKVFLLLDRSEASDRIASAFESAQFDVFRTEDMNASLRGLHGLGIHCMVVDWDVAGSEVRRITHAIKEECHRTGLIMFSKCQDMQLRIQAIDEGADDCLGKPINTEELIAKVRAVIRRIDLVYQEPRTLKIHDIEINLDSHEVRKEGELIDLTYTQFKLLYLLASRREYVFTRDEILQKVWGEHAYVTDRTVDVHVKRLREKLGEYQGALKYIQTIHGLGYRFA